MIARQTRPSLRHTALAALALLATPVAARSSQDGATPGFAAAQQTAPAGGVGYADLTDLVLAAPVIADATVRSTSRIKGAEAADLAPGMARLYVTVDVTALVRGAQGLPPRIGYLLDLPLGAGGRVPNLKKARVLVLARPVPGAADQVQLVARDAQLLWTPETDSRIRGIARDVLAADAPPTITGVGNAFHVPGALPGEGETQIFLTTADQRPVSLSVLRRPGEQPRWAVALSEIVDEAAVPPPRDTLLWYRLACALPATLPERSTAALEAPDAQVAQEDYRFVIGALGECGRTRT